MITVRRLRVKDHTIPIGLARSNPLGYSVEPLLQGASSKGSLAERVGFEPTSRLLVNTLSKRAPSATRTPLRDFAPQYLSGSTLPDRISDAPQPD